MVIGHVSLELWSVISTMLFADYCRYIWCRKKQKNWVFPRRLSRRLKELVCKKKKNMTLPFLLVEKCTISTSQKIYMTMHIIWLLRMSRKCIRCLQVENRWSDTSWMWQACVAPLRLVMDANCLLEWHKQLMSVWHLTVAAHCFVNSCIKNT